MRFTVSAVGRLAVRGILGIVLLLSGVGKLIDSSGAEALVGVVMGSDSVLVDYAAPLVLLVSIGELALVGWLAWGRFLTSALATTFLVFAVFTVVVGSIVVGDQTVATCGCFGALGIDLSAEATLIRNLVLLAVTLVGILLTDTPD